MMTCLCVIPARGGSKRIPRKNILPLNGLPLIVYTLRAARGAGVFTAIVVSTDDEEIGDLARAQGVAVDDRPASLSGDRVTMVQVVREYLQRTQAVEAYQYVAALLPTCPFRTAEDVRNAYQLLVSQTEHQFLVGTTEYEFPIQLALEASGGCSVRMVFEDGYQTTRSQSIAKRYHPNGAIYLAETQAFLRAGTFFQPKMMHYNMPADRSFDIDYPHQFEIAEVLARRVFDDA